MRPRRRIILIDGNAERRGWTRFVLDNKGYLVICAASCAVAAEIGSEERCMGHTDTLLVGYHPVSENFLLDVATTLGFPWLLIAPRAELGMVWPSMAGVLERVKVAAMRKRGPRKAFIMGVVAREEVLA